MSVATTSPAVDQPATTPPAAEVARVYGTPAVVIDLDRWLTLSDAQIRVGVVVIAEFRGHSRTVGGSFIDGGDPASETPTP